MLVMRKLLAIFLLLLLGSQSQAQENLRVMTYNLLFYGAAGPSGSSCTPTSPTARNAWFSTVMNATLPDIFGVNEIGPFESSTSPASNILLNVLQPINPAYRRATVNFSSGQNITNAFFYNSDKVGLALQDVIPHPFRPMDYYKLYYKGPGLASGDTTFVEVVLVHFSAGTTSIQLSQAQTAMAYLDNLGRSGNYIIMGDMNLSSSNSGPFQVMIAHPNQAIRMRDPINLTGNWTTNSARHSWTQSTRNSSGSDCGVGGGLDDRFDLILCSNSIMNNSDFISYVPNSYQVVGNPNSPNPSYPQAVQFALTPLSDHHPVVLDLEVDRLVAVENALPEAFRLEVLGQPATEALQVRLTAPELARQQVQLGLFDLQGKAVLVQEASLGVQTTEVRVPLAHVCPGLYLLRATSESGAVVTRKVVVQ